MTDLLNRLLDPYANVPDHLVAGPLRSPSQAFDTDIPLTQEQERIRSQLAAVADLLDTPAPPSLATLVADTPPEKLSKAVADAAAAQTQREWVSKAAADLRRRLMHERVAAGSHADVLDATLECLAEQIEQNVSGLLVSAKTFGEALLGKTDKLLEQDAQMVQRVKTSIVELASLSRVRVAGQTSGDHLRTVALFAELDPEEAEGGDRGTLTLAAGSAKKSQGVLLAALSLGQIPGLTLSVAPDWQTVQQRRAALDELKKTLAEGEPTVTMAEPLLDLGAEGF